MGGKSSSPETSGLAAAGAAAAEENGVLCRKPALCRACVCSPNPPTILKNTGAGDVLLMVECHAGSRTLHKAGVKVHTYELWLVSEDGSRRHLSPALLSVTQ